MALNVWRLTLCVVGWNPLAMALQSSKGHHKCKHLVNLTDYMYPDNWVLESCIVCHHMFGWFMHLWLLNCMLNCMINPFYSSLSFLFACVSRMWFSPFAMIINLLMWANVKTTSDCSGDGDVVAKLDMV